MAKIDMQKIRRINDSCANGFQVDLSYMAAWGEVEIRKDIAIDPEENTLISAKLMFNDTFKNYRKIGVEPVLRLDKLVRTSNGSGFYRVLFVYSANIGDMITRRNNKLLCNLTANYPDEKILELAGISK